MSPTVLAITVLCALARLVTGSIGHEVPLGELAPPVVTATSSQYFERTFNHLVGPALVPESPVPVQPVIPVQAPEVIQNHAVLQPPQPELQFHSVLSARGPPVIPAFHVIPSQPVLPAERPVFFQPAPNAVSGNPVFVNTSQPNSSQSPVDPNIAIAIATAHGAAPVATFLLPPYPFGPPPLGFVPPVPFNAPEEPREESTTPTPKDTSTTVIEPEQTTPQPSAAPSNTANSFAQVLPNQNVNFMYGPPPDLPRPLQPFPLQGEEFRPQKQKTTVEIIPVPLTYMSPPPLTHDLLHHQQYHHHQYNHNQYHQNPYHQNPYHQNPYHQSPYHPNHKPHHYAKIVKYYVQTVPAPVRAKIIIKPVTSSVPLRYGPKSAKPVILKKYRVPISWERSDVEEFEDQQMARLGPPKEREPTTMGPINIGSPSTKPPRV